MTGTPQKPKSGLGKLAWHQLRCKAGALVDELVELVLCFLLSSQWVDYLIQQAQNIAVARLLIELRDHQNFFGLLKVAFPILFFILVGSFRRLLRCLSGLYQPMRAKLKGKLRISMPASSE